MPLSEEAQTPLRVLMVEDEENDVLLTLRTLERGHFALSHRRVDTATGLETALDEGQWDVVIADYALPQFSGLAALEIVKTRAPDLPFIVVSGAIGEETAVALMRAGAHDYVMKSALGRLVPAITREMKDAETRRARRESEHALREAHERLRALSGRMLDIQEQEKRHIARELHDEIGQVLTAVKISLQSVLLNPEGERDTERVTDSIAVVDNALTQVRSLSLNLRPPHLDDLGLQPALRWFLDRNARVANIAVELRIDPVLGRMAPQLETACFRIVQEAVTNALRHGHPSRIAVELRLDGRTLHLAIRDDGCGFDVGSTRLEASGRSLGLAGIEERAMLAGGRSDIESWPGRGTEVRAWLEYAGSEGTTATEYRNPS
jgi:signal transduction histidine kinase